MRVDPASRSLVVTLVGGYPVTDNEFNYDGYTNGVLELTVPVGWTVTVQCLNHSAVPNSCAVVSGPEATQPMSPGWSTPDPQQGLAPGKSAAFLFTPDREGDFRIASLTPGGEAGGMWMRLVVSGAGRPAIGAGD